MLSDNYFQLKEVDFKDSFSVTCEKNLIFGANFPYWKIPGMDYPAVTESECLTALECQEKIDLGEDFADDFDQISKNLEDTFEYYCHLNGARGFTDNTVNYIFGLFS